MTASDNPVVREIDAALQRESAYKAVLERLKAGAIRQPEAVNALRHAYHRAELHARGMREIAYGR